MQQKRVLVGTSMTSICHVALSLLQLQLLAPRHCHLKLRKSCKIWKWPLKIKQLSLSLCYKERGRNDMLRHQSSQKKKKKVSREQLDLGVTVRRGQRNKKARVCKVKRRLAQIRQQKRSDPVIWLEVFWTCCA